MGNRHFQLTDHIWRAIIGNDMDHASSIGTCRGHRPEVLIMYNATRSLVVTAAALLTLGSSTAIANAEPPAPGSPCGPDKVITSVNTCEPLNSPCTGYDGMVIGRVAADGRCVIPGLDGTRW